MNFEMDENTYKEIEQMIHSNTSPVGIDAKKTHILILNALSEVNRKLDLLMKEMEQPHNKN